MIAYDPRGMTWPQYNGLMAELFAAQQLGVVPEDQWKDWAQRMINQGFFPKDGIPLPGTFGTWQEWAQRLCGIINIRK